MKSIILPAEDSVTLRRSNAASIRETEGEGEREREREGGREGRDGEIPSTHANKQGISPEPLTF